MDKREKMNKKFSIERDGISRYYQKDFKKKKFTKSHS